MKLESHLAQGGANNVKATGVRFLASALFTAVLFGSCDNRVRIAQEDRGEGSEADSNQTVALEAPLLDVGTSSTNQRGGKEGSVWESIINTPRSDYVFPVIAGSLGSAWCVCRSIGTSPHVGQDIIDGGVGTQKSIAMSNGVVRRVTFDASCGWSVTFRDSMGADWRFVHLNSPEVKMGQAVARGTVLGINRDFPTAGCGTGAHLHLERRSAGAYGSSEEFNTCQFGRQSCFYDPVAPLRQASRVPNESARVAIVNSSPLMSPAQSSMRGGLAMPSLRLPVPQIKGPKLAPSHLASGLLPSRNKVPYASDCTAFVPDPVWTPDRDTSAGPGLGAANPQSNPSLAGLKTAQGEQLLQSQVELRYLLRALPKSDKGWRHWRIGFELNVPGNEKNLCGRKKTPGSRPCVESWSVQFVSGSGEIAHVMGSVGTGGRPVQVPESTKMCARTQAHERVHAIRFLVTTSDGQTVTKEHRVAPSGRLR